MDSAHVIESLGFELEYASEERTFERQERLAGFARGRGLQVIAEVFDEMSPPGGEVLRLDRLELDLGPVDEEDLEHDLARRLREALRLALSDGLYRAREEAGRLGSLQAPDTRHALPSPHTPRQSLQSPFQPPHAPFGLSLSKPPSPAHQPFDMLKANGVGEAPSHNPPQASVHPRTHAWRAALLHFLEHGHLPWHADRHLAANLGAALQVLLHDDGPAFAAALHALPPTSPAWRRLAGLAPPPLRLHLARLLAPTAGDWLQDLAAALDNPAPAAGAQGWRDQAWATLLPALMAPGSAATLPARLREPLRAVMATVADPAQQPALAAVRAALGEPAPHHLDSQPDTQPDAGDSEDSNPPSQRSFWRARVEAALQAGSLAGTADAWRALLRHDRGWLRTRIAALGRSARTRRTLAHGLDPALLHALIGVWVNAAMQGLMVALIHRLQQFAGEAAARGQAAMARITAPVLWEHTLAHLWVEGETDSGVQAHEASRAPPSPASAGEGRGEGLADAMPYVESLLRRLSQAQDISPDSWASASDPAVPKADFRAAAAQVLRLLRTSAPEAPAPHGGAASPALPQAPAETPSPAAMAPVPPPPANLPQPPSRDTGPADARVRLWRHLLLAALTAPEGAAHAPDPRSLEGLLRQDPAWLRATLQRLGHAAHVRRRIAQDLGPALLRDLLGLWVSPARQDAIAAFVHGLASLARRQPALARLSAAGLWAHVLGHLWLEQDPARPHTVADEQALPRSVLRQLAEHGEIAPSGWPALLGPGANLDTALPWVLAQIGRLLPGAAEDGAGSDVTAWRGVMQPHMPSPPTTSAGAARERAGAGTRAPSQASAAIGRLPSPQPSPAEAGEGARGTAASAAAGGRMRGPATAAETGERERRPDSPSETEERVRGAAAAADAGERERGPASPAEAGRRLAEAASAADAEAGAKPAAPDPAAPPPRIHAWRRLLLAALAPAAAAAPLPPALDARCWAGLLRHDAAWLRATLQRLGRSAAVRRRIAHGLDAGLLRDLTGLWVVPARQDFMAATVHGLERLARRQPALSGVAAAGLWEHTLAWLWLERRAAPEDALHDERAFVQSVLRHLERHGDVAPTAWQALLGPAADLEAAVPWVLAQVGTWAQDGPAAAQPGGMAAARAADVLPVAGAQVADPQVVGSQVAGPQVAGASPAGRVQRQADASAPPGDSSPPAPLDAQPKAATQAEAPATSRTLRAWRRMLRTMLAPQGSGAAQAPWDPACWEGLLRHDALWLRAKVQRLGRFASVRRAMARGLSPALLRELAGLWVGPDRQDFIAAFVQGLERLAAANPALPRVAGPDLWAQALGPLWVDPQGARPGAEGERAFVMGMLRQLEQHEGVDPAAWAGAAGAGDAEAATAWVQRQIRAALAGERPGAVDGRADEPGPLPRRAQLAAALSAGRFEADFEALWFDASRDDALWLRALLCREDLAAVESGEAWALGQAQGEQEAEGESVSASEAPDAASGHATTPSPTPDRPELVEGLVPLAPGLPSTGSGRSEIPAQPEREGVSESERAAADAGEPTHSTQPTPGLAPRPAPIAALRRTLAQRLPQPRWQQSLSPWLTPGEGNELAATVRRLAQAAIQHEPQAGDLEPWLWDRTLARLWRLPPQRLDLHALAQHLAQDLAHRSTPSPASAGEGRGEGSGLGGAEGWATANHAPHPNPLPLMREREFVGAPLPPMPERESAASPLPPTPEKESAASTLPPMPERESAGSPPRLTPERAPAGSPLPPMAQSESAHPPPPATPENDPAEQALLRALQARVPLSPADAALWRARWAATTAHPSPHWRHHLRQALETPPAATRLVELLPRADLVATLRLLRPTEHADWQATATLITQACRATGTAGVPGQLEALAWQAIFREAIEEGRPLHTAAHIAGFARRLVAELARQLMPPDPPHWKRTLVQALARGSDTLAAALRADLQQPTPPAPIDAAPWDRPVLDWDDLADGDAIHVGNAGLVLAGPYLPRLLRMLGLAGDVAFTPPEAAAERGVHLLQAVVDGRGDTAEPLLVLNKLLCGLPLAAPVPPGIELTAEERAAIDGMLKAMIQHWRTLGNTSVAGLRETFLQREGRLMRKNDAWHLVVERRPLDVLLDRLPWGFATLKYPWMEQVLHVQWS